MTRHVEIRFVTPSLALVNGPGTRQMRIELGGRPLWATISRGWVTTPARARDLVAVLEYRGGFDISVTTEAAS